MRGAPEITASTSAYFLRYPAGVRWTPQRIKERRGELGWRQEDLAEQLGVSLRSVTSWERGEAAPRHPALLNAVLGDPGTDEQDEPAPRRDLTAATPVELVATLLSKVTSLEREAAKVPGLEREVTALREQLRNSFGIEEGPVPDEIWSDPDLIEGPQSDGDPDDEQRHASR